MIDEEGTFILWMLARRPRSIASMERESSIPKTTLYRKIGELVDRGWILNEDGMYKLSERGRILLRMEASEMLGTFYVESLYSKAARLSVGGWEKALEVLKRCLSESKSRDRNDNRNRYVLTYETAAYLRTGFQVPSAVFAYVLEEELNRIISCSRGRKSGIADLVLIPVRELPPSELVHGLPVVTMDRLKLELLTWLGRGVIDLAALGEELPEVPEEMTDVFFR